MDMLKMDALEEGGIYRITARNFFVGAWNGTNGFIGIRQKFSDRYLFTEYHHDYSPHVGTARPWEKVGQVPEGVELIERTPTECSDCGRPAHFERDDPGSPRGHWFHADGSPVCEGGAVTLTYQPLFDVLEPYRKAEDERWIEEENARKSNKEGSS